MEDSVPTRKRGHPRKIPCIDADRQRSITGVCRCGTLMQAKQGPRSVREYTEEFLETAKICKSKSAEDWCRWQWRQNGHLPVGSSPSSSEEEMEVEEDPSEDSEWEEESASPTGSARDWS
ncbi:hypothetical protein YC2023_010563 [Brassica napus]